MTFFRVVDGDDSAHEPDGQPYRPCRLDFYCDFSAEIPLWINGTGMARAARVPVSAGLREALTAFQARFEGGFGPDDDAPFPDDFEAAGRALLQRVRAELPSPPWRITSRLWLEADDSS